ncbi:MAG: metallophosphoesterase family protein [Candidatus Cloacimonetes bacterium]|nr:metallophosphoesterase family protein [Candidatus Cloacimonadota bacterium]
MVKVLVISDTHGNQKLLRQVLEREQEAQIIFHLGDFYDDLDHNIDLLEGKQVFRVPGIFNSGYFSGKLSATCVTEINGWKVGCVHSPQDIPKLPRNLDLIMHGHTHNPNIGKQLSCIILNPGHLKNIIDRSNMASYAILEISETQLKIKIIQINCNLKEVNTFKK